MYRALPYLVEPEWTRGHAFTVALRGRGRGWRSLEREGARRRAAARDLGGRRERRRHRERARLPRCLRADGHRALSPTDAMQQQLIRIEGEIHPVTLLGRWIERSEGRDDAELSARAPPAARCSVARGALGLRNGGGRRRQGDPAHRSAGRAGSGATCWTTAAVRAVGAPELARARARLHASTRSSGWRRRARPSENTMWCLGRSTSARSAWPPTWRRSCWRPRAARSRSSSRRSSWTRLATPPSSTASAPR